MQTPERQEKYLLALGVGLDTMECEFMAVFLDRSKSQRVLAVGVCTHQHMDDYPDVPVYHLGTDNDPDSLPCTRRGHVLVPVPKNVMFSELDITHACLMTSPCLP